MTKRQHEQIRRAAARGAKWLDKHTPGWSRKVNRRKLELGSTRFCILGQIHGAHNQKAFDQEADALGLSEDECDRLGFSLSYRLCEESDSWDALTDAWRDELKVRPR